MLRRKSSSVAVPNTSSSTSSSRSQSPTPGGWDADDELGTMSGDDVTSPRPITISIPPRHPSSSSTSSGPVIKRPTLKEILSNTSAPPWTLTAFMAYLSNNHCLETLEFTMDAMRYKKHHAKVLASKGDSIPASSKDAANMRMLWQRLIDAYIRPNGSREINIPSEVRDPILNQDNLTGPPPPPEALDIAVAKVYELMEDSVLVPFLNSLTPPSYPVSPSGNGCECSPDQFPISPRNERKSSSRNRFSRHSPPSSSTSPTESGSVMSLPGVSSTPSHTSSTSNRKSTSITNAFHKQRMSAKLSPTSSSATNTSSTAPMPVPSAISGEPVLAPGLTDDSGYTSSHTNESIMTPPVSPPDSNLMLSPRSSRDSSTWKKLGRLSQWKPMRKKSHNNFHQGESGS